MYISHKIKAMAGSIGLLVAAWLFITGQMMMGIYVFILATLIILFGIRDSLYENKNFSEGYNRRRGELAAERRFYRKRKSRKR